MNPGRLFKDIAASAARFRDVPRRVAQDVADRLTRDMARVSAQKGRKRSGSAAPVDGGVLVRAYTANPHAGPWWLKILARSARFHMRRAADGKD